MLSILVVKQVYDVGSDGRRRSSTTKIVSGTHVQTKYIKTSAVTGTIKHNPTIMGSCWGKLEEQEDSAALGIVPVTEVSRNATSELVITPSHFKFSETAAMENKNNSTLLSLELLADRDDDSMRTGFQYDCKIFT